MFDLADWKKKKNFFSGYFPQWVCEKESRLSSLLPPILFSPLILITFYYLLIYLTSISIYFLLSPSFFLSRYLSVSLDVFSFYFNLFPSLSLFLSLSFFLTIYYYLLIYLASILIYFLFSYSFSHYPLLSIDIPCIYFNFFSAHSLFHTLFEAFIPSSLSIFLYFLF